MVDHKAQERLKPITVEKLWTPGNTIRMQNEGERGNLEELRESATKPGSRVIIIIIYNLYSA